MEIIPTFAIVKGKGFIQPVQVIAAFMLIIFVCIHITKSLHHHALQQESAQAFKSTIKDADCGICDYHFVKDAHDDVHPIDIIIPAVLSVHYKSLKAIPTTSIGSPSSDRGPPSLV